MIAPAPHPGPLLTDEAALTASQEEIAVSAPARALSGLYHRCGAHGGSPYTIEQLFTVLAGLRYFGTAQASDVGRGLSLPASAVYGCFLELEDFGLLRWLAHPVISADYVTAEITDTGLRLLREINHPPVCGDGRGCWSESQSSARSYGRTQYAQRPDEEAGRGEVIV